MYTVDDKDTVISLEAVPRSSVGAPMPIVVCDEHTLFLAYYVQRHDPDMNGTTVRVVGPRSPGEETALIEFQRCHAHMFGPPSDEAFAGHPLAGRGLRPYRAFRIDQSSWVRSMERRSSAHPSHRPGSLRNLQHFVFAFHDSTFECVATRFESSLHSAGMAAMLGIIKQRMEWDDV